MQVEKVKQATRKGDPRQPRASQARPAHEDEAVRIARNIQAMGPDIVEFARRLLVANMMEMWADCPHDACRRAKTCRGEDVACFKERRAELTRRILKHVFLLLFTADVSSDAFYDYLDSVTEDADDEDGNPDL